MGIQVISYGKQKQITKYTLKNLIKINGQGEIIMIINTGNYSNDSGLRIIEFNSADGSFEVVATNFGFSDPIQDMIFDTSL